jgi:hypothetical protein
MIERYLDDINDAQKAEALYQEKIKRYRTEFKNTISEFFLRL